MIRVVLSEAHPLLRQGLCSILHSADGIRVVGLAGTGRETLEQEERHTPDLHLIGALLPPTSGYEVARQLSRRRPAVGLLIVAPARLAHEEQVGSVGRALAAGARGYLAGEADP